MSKNLRARNRRRLWALVVGLGFLAANAPALLAQDAAAQPSYKDGRCFVKKLNFDLPLNINEATRAATKEVKLYCKPSPTSAWVLLESCPPTRTKFSFRARKDGEYVFTISMVDNKTGLEIPPDPDQSKSRIVVVIDTTPPQVDIQFVGTTSDGHNVQVDVRDDNLDPKQTVVSYQTKDLQFRPLTETGEPNHYTIPIQAAFTGMVRVRAGDHSKNVTQRDFDLKTQVGSNTPSPATSPNTGAVITIEHAPIPTPTPPGPIVTPDNHSTTDTQEPLPAPIVTPAPNINKLPEPPVAVPENFPTVAQPMPTPAVTPGKPALPTQFAADSRTAISHHIINHKQLRLDYKIEQVGPSGVGKVEVWITKDQSKSWERLGADAEAKSPVAIELPGEGLYGISLVVTNGRGYGGAPPKSGDAPDAWIEVDMTKPVVDFTNIRCGTGDDAGTILVSWLAQDRNLAADAVDLYFATTRDGNWQAVARGLKGEGRHRWVPPSGVGSQVFFRLVAHDLAGNVAVVETPQAVVVDDQSRPRGRLLSISPIAPEVRLEPRGN